MPRLPQISLGNASMGAVDFSGATINLGVNLSNPNQFALPLGSLNYKVSVAGSNVAQSAANPGSLAPGGTQSLPLAVRVNFIDAGLGVVNAIRQGRATLAFDGALDLGIYKHPIHLEQIVGR